MNKKPENNTINIYQKIETVQQKIGDEPTKKEAFFRSFDQIMNKYGIKGTTDIDNLKSRMKLLKNEEFDRIKNYLEKIAK